MVVDLPIVLPVDAELLGGNVEVWIAIGEAHASNSARRREALWKCPSRIGHDGARVSPEVDFKRRITFEETAFNRVIDEVHTKLKGMPPDGLRYIVLEHPLLL